VSPSTEDKTLAWTTIAEIQGFANTSGLPKNEDIDSRPDSDFNNDSGGNTGDSTDDETGGDGSGDPNDPVKMTMILPSYIYVMQRLKL